MASETPGPVGIDAYGAGHFRVGGQVFNGSVLVLGGHVVAWSADIAALKPEDFAAVMAQSPPPDILLIGCGRRAAMIPPAIRQHLRTAGIVVDAMDTGAACRTYNVLLGESRRVAAALIAVE
jgi:uncharacterized protein